VAVVVLVSVERSIALNWNDLRSQPVQWTIRPLPLVGSLLLVWLMYANLIAAWRTVLGRWGERLPPMEAARIWAVSNLGKYVPGKVWAIAGMALMAREAGVAVWAATAPAVVALQFKSQAYERGRLLSIVSLLIVAGMIAFLPRLGTGTSRHA
jgi:hypothetical protein